MFIGLSPEPHNLIVYKLLFLLAHWHGLAKLWMHTDKTLEVLEWVLARLGSQLCTFAGETCPSFSTLELRHVAESHRRHQARAGKNGIAQTWGTSAITTGNRHLKVLNLQMYKLHALGDYPAQIRMYGTTDSYLTQLVSCIALC